MLIDKDQDLRLSLGLSSSEARCSLHLNLMPSTAICLTQSEQRTVLASQGIDVNRAPMAEIEIEEEAAASSPNSTVSTENCGGKRRFYAGGGEEIDGDEEDGDGSRKKLRLSKDQSAILEESFKENNTLNPKQKLALANKLNLRPRQVEVWFQNRRARTKLKQTEVDCEFLKLCCENLTEENRRLQKEVQELRSLKLSPQFFMQMTPPTTLTMCPSCERIAVSNNSTAAPPPPPATLPRADMHQIFHRPVRSPVAAIPGWAPIVLRPAFLNATAKPQRY